ncbi:hypothetical protein [Vibrio sp. Vb0587]|uniref:hypothetical protein n=1 Tax=Vibrio sp. Vb0587 TaxID=3074626 RepID=UPI000657298C|nr:hypothetical protein [Vibrio sp. Vb0587]AKO78043.1 hypothetical protein EN12_23375 [Vibrio cholerae]MDW1965642.1 hypothetical protein [Vibrio sp. Vb0587]
MTKFREIKELVLSHYSDKKKDALQPGEVFKAIDPLKRPNRFLIEIDDDSELEELIALHIACSHAPKPKKPKKPKNSSESTESVDPVVSIEPVEPVEPEAFKLTAEDLFKASSMNGVIPEKDEAMVAKLMEMVATHLPKHNEALVNGKNVFAINQNEVKNWGVCSLNPGTDKVSKRLAFSGDASVSPKKCLYALEFLLRGKRTSFIEQIASKNKIIVNTLLKAGFKQDSISLMESIALKMLSCGTPDFVEGNQILWFVGDEQYHVISPMPSAQMIADINESIKTTREDSYLPIIHKSIGGIMNPLNASDLNVLIGGGSSQVLWIDLSFLNKEKSKIEKLIGAKKPLISRIYLSDYRLDKTAILDKKLAGYYRKQISQAILSSLTLIIEMKDMIKEGLYSIEDIAVNEERLFMKPFSSQEDVNLCKKYLVKNVIASYNNEKLSIDDVMQKEIETAASIIIERFS